MAQFGGSTQSDTLTSESGIGSILSGSADAQMKLPEEDRKKAEWIWALYQKAKKWKVENGCSDWQKWWDFWRGKQWQKRRPSSLSMAVINEVYSAVETFMGSLADDLTDSIVLARRKDEKSTADTLTKLLNWVHDINEFGTETELPVRSALVTGTGVRRVDWDCDMDKKRGAPRYTFIDENNFFPAPYTRQINDAEYVIEAKNIPISFVRSTWGEDGWRVPGGVWDGTLTPLYAGSQAQTGDVATFTIPDGTQTQQSKSTLQKKEKDLVTLIELWIRQDDGTMRYIVCANGLILQDGPSPYNDEAYPYVVYNVIRNKNSIYGYSLVEQLEKMQTELNEIHSYMLDQQKYESDSPLVVRVENLEEGKVFSNSPGSVYVDKSEGGNGYYVLNKPGGNPKWMEMEGALRDKIRGISGGVDILHGERPAGVTTLGGMEIVRQQANVIVAKMTTHIQAAIRNEDVLCVNRIIQFFKEERVIRVVGKGNMPDYVAINERISMDPNGEWVRKNVIPDDFECDVDFSPVPPGGYQAKFERAMALLQGGVVDAQYVLEQIDEDQDQIDAVQQRMQAQAQAQAQAEGAAQGGTQVGPDGQPAQAEEDPQSVIQRVMSMMAG